MTALWNSLGQRVFGPESDNHVWTLNEVMLQTGGPELHMWNDLLEFAVPLDELWATCGLFARTVVRSKYSAATIDHMATVYHTMIDGRNKDRKVLVLLSDSGSQTAPSTAKLRNSFTGLLFRGMKEYYESGPLAIDILPSAVGDYCVYCAPTLS
ncbi:hypothetical protein CC1G_14096 [Coprinopsis cinerea okayama7|uniref:Uncharacterized protein n=1 Tax=Coprinopsis cinerea (strain Okayama-7 / 130 / ATCC MYA-4618 / FGSC 9003) TaxID=240176 RepID=D6RLH8_COPC7|nr:hypothetical protein CC1G_14096 [Coprinopsis cinerea okayama7\|eukprot:XP_002911564.1 hypothetical protein CC1G_14096 [Coprinopsis cinerea okayama7\